MRRTITSLNGLREAGLVEAIPALVAVTDRYAVAITPAMVDLIRQGETAIAAQFLPDPRESITTPDESPDPIGDHTHSPLKGLVHRYPDRVLLKVLHACPVYCRFCFRREMVGPDGDGTLSETELDQAFAYIAATPAIFEVILTGGDPLMLSARRIQALGERLAQIPHVQLVRWHSRVPVVSPERITAELVRALRIEGKAVSVAIHANHASEFTSEAKKAIARLADAGIVLLGQTVLLKGVNAETETLATLFRAMAANRIRPLYLHHPDLAPGTGHFRLPIAEGQAIYGALRGQLPGPAIPAYVLDLPGGHGKVPIGPGHCRETEDGIEILDPAGTWRLYRG
ncbi:MAG: lysine-2,3-aminomutase-like protein [Rhizobiales bacterium]|nr:lysine-2,3-aminomutase-like protein [Hyphomicrobiales bacterium]